MSTSGFAGLSRFLKCVMIGSLALNLVVIGALATAWVRHGGKHHHFHHGGLERSLMHFGHRELPREKRKALRKAWRKERDTLKPLYEGVREARKNVGVALQAKPYDRMGVATALDQVRQKRSLVRQRMAQTYLDLVDTLTDEEKQAFGKFIQKDRRGKWRRGHKRRRHRD